MYASFINQAANFSRFFIAFLFLFFIVPSIVSGIIDEDRTDNYAANYIRAVFFVITTGYLLAATKLFEFLTLFLVIILSIYRKLLSESKLMGRKSQERPGLLILKVLDRQVHIIKSAAIKVKNTFFIHIKTSLSQLTPDQVVFTILTIIILFISAYIRFYDAFTHAAMPLSDSYITLDWLKGVERRQLFYEPGGGVYPRGLSIFMATIHKFSFIDALYILKYSGPLNGFLIVVSILYVVYKLTKSKYAALIASALYGIGGGILGSEIERQAATNSQEFALVFFLPTIYFSYKYMRERRKRDSDTVIIGLTIMGLAHTFVYFFGVIAVSINIAILFLKSPIRNFKDYSRLVLGGIFSAVISLLPFGVGMLEGVGLHGSSVEFLTGTREVLFKQLSATDYIAVIAFLIFGVLLLLMSRDKSTEALSLLPVFLTIVSIFLVYYVGGYITKSTLLDTRTKEIWAVCAALSVGMGYGIIMSHLDVGKNARKVCRFCSITICLVSIGTIFNTIGIKPLEPYKMEWDSGVEQYLKIAKEYSPKSWTMVAEERQYAMITGTGFLVTTEHFTDDYSAEEPFTENWGNIGNHIFIYQQKNVYEIDHNNVIYAIEGPKYEKMRSDGEVMNQWLERFSASGGEYQIYYEDRNIRILYIHNKAYDHDNNEKLWGDDT